MKMNGEMGRGFECARDMMATSDYRTIVRNYGHSVGANSPFDTGWQYAIREGMCWLFLCSPYADVLEQPGCGETEVYRALDRFRDDMLAAGWAQVEDEMYISPDFLVYELTKPSTPC